MSDGYHDLHIDLRGDRSRGFEAFVLDSSAGDPWARLDLPCAPAELPAYIGFLRSLLSPWRPIAHFEPAWAPGADPASLPTRSRLAYVAGRRLFNALFSGELQTAYHRVYDKHRADGRPLRIRLSFRSPVLTALPWELMLRPEGSYLALTPGISLVRYSMSHAPSAPLSVTLPLRVLVIVSAPVDMPPLDVQAEIHRIERALTPLRQRRQIELSWLKDDVTQLKLRERLRTQTWHVIHYIGHARYDAAEGEGVLFFSDEEGHAVRARASDIAAALAPTIDAMPRLIFINACEGAAGGPLDHTTSLATALIRHGVPAVVAASEPLEDRVASALSQPFYKAIVEGRTIDDAVVEARATMKSARDDHAAWAALGLQLRAPDGHLFAVRGSSLDPAVRRACCVVVAGEDHAVGYLISPGQVATSAHIAGRAGASRMLRVLFEDLSLYATISFVDKTADAAILTLPYVLEQPPALGDQLPDTGTWKGIGFASPAWHDLEILGGSVLVGQAVQGGSPVGTLKVDPWPAGEPMCAAGSPVIAGGRIAAQIRGAEPLSRATQTLQATPIGRVLRLLNARQPGDSEPAFPQRYSAWRAPEIPLDEYHAFVSYAAPDREWVLRLVNRLAGLGLKLFLDEGAIRPDQSILGALGSALRKSRAALVISSKDWLASRSRDEESNALVARVAADQGFRILVVCLDSDDPTMLDAAVPRLAFARGEVPEGEKLARMLTGILGDAAPAPTSAPWLAALASSDDMVAEIRASNTERGVLEMWEKWQRMGYPLGPLALCAADALIGMGCPDQALAMLDKTPNDLRAKQLRALALSRLGMNDEAIAILTALYRNGLVDAETAGLLAGRYKARWLEQKSPQALELAYQIYLETFQRTGAPYLGINAATMELLKGNPERAQGRARQVLDLLSVQSSEEEWRDATLGEAWLLLGHFQQACDHYRAAVARAANMPAHIATMRHQALLALSALRETKPHVWGLEWDELKSILAVRGVAAFVGHMTDGPDREHARFPPEKVKSVRLAIRKRLEKLDIGFGFTSAARGADLIFIDELVRRNGQVTVYLPFPKDGFMETSVNYGWDERFESLLKRPHVRVHVLSEATPPTKDGIGAAAMACARKVREMAQARARSLHVKPRLITVWDGREGDGAGGTSDAVMEWRSDVADDSVEWIDVTAL